jgi:ferredoxin
MDDTDIRKDSMKASIRYFSGTGNSWRIATACAESFRTAGYAVDTESIRAGRPPDRAAESACFCFPVHSLDLPRNAAAYLRGLPAGHRSIPALLLVTGGDPDNCGWAVETGARILEERGYDVRIGGLVHMPNNWTPFHSPPDPAEAERIIARGVRSAGELVTNFLEGRTRLKAVSLRKFGVIGSVMMRNIYHRRGAYQLWRFFETGLRCTGCGLCERICPTGSIRLADGRPVWSNGCVQCMRCFNYCPARAIRQLEFLLRGNRHRAYRMPGFHPAEEPR